MNRMKKIVLSTLLLFILLNAKATSFVSADRWLEIDLFWFNKNDMKASSIMFWERMYPLFADIYGEKGVIVNLGWLMDFILEWNGSLDAPIPFPKGMIIWGQFKDEGYILGNTEQRMECWENRFSNVKNSEAAWISGTATEYDNWTYRDLKNFIVIFKQAAVKYGIRDIKVGTLALGWKTAYHGNESRFAAKHPEAYSKKAVCSSYECFNPTYILKNDKTHYGAYPGGIPESGLAVTTFFGNQWGDLSKKVGLDAIVLRDSSIGQGIYRRLGPYGHQAPDNPAEVMKWSKAYADLVQFTKQSNPKAFVIGYSNGAAAVGGWRVNCFDLESIANEGFLDAYIDQSWAGAWNEVGQRPYTFWNDPQMGWTYQLSFILVHGAILSKTSTKHYFLTNTFDAWESWNIIGCARERLRWSIWAYSHAGIKTPNGLKFPDGSYISWANQVKRLLSDEEINFLSTETNHAFRDLNNIRDINGPTLVYSRSAMEWQTANQPEIWMKEWIDDQCGSIMKFSAPILSAACIEDLGRIESDMFIVQTPVHLKTNEKEQLEKLIVSGKPVMICGSPANGIDADILHHIGLTSFDKVPDVERYEGFINNINHPLAANCPRTFLIYQPYTINALDENAKTEVIYSVSNSPALVRKGNLLIWDAPEHLIYTSTGKCRWGLATDELLGSAVPYALTARFVNDELSKTGKFNAFSPDTTLPVWCGSWTNKSGELTVLIADLEEGLEHTGKEQSFIELKIPQMNGTQIMYEQWRANSYIISGNMVRYSLRRGESSLLNFKK